MKRHLLALICIACLGSLPSFAGVSVDHDSEIDFSAYRTFAWKQGTPARSDLVEKRIRNAVQRELEAKGLTLADGPADVYVVTHVSVEGHTRVDVDHLGYRGSWRGYGTSTVHVQEVNVGTLVVDLLDGKEQQLIWRAINTQTLPTNPKPEKIEKKINKVTAKMFRDFPPSP